MILNFYFQFLIFILLFQFFDFYFNNKNRTNTLGTNTCVSSTIIPLVYDSYSLYALIVHMLTKFHEMEELEEELEGLLNDAKKRFYSLYETLRKFYESASTIKYVTTLCVVPVLPEEPPQFGGKPKKIKRNTKPQKTEEDDFIWHENRDEFVWHESSKPQSPRRQEMDNLLDLFKNVNFNTGNTGNTGNTNFQSFNVQPSFNVNRNDPSNQMSFVNSQFSQSNSNSTPSSLTSSFQSTENLQQDRNEQEKQIEELKNLINKEREQARQVFSGRDQIIQQWLLMNKQLTEENDDLERQLDSLLKENEMLRQLIKKAKESHAEAVRTLIGTNII